MWGLKCRPASQDLFGPLHSLPQTDLGPWGMKSRASHLSLPWDKLAAPMEILEAEEHLLWASETWLPGWSLSPLWLPLNCPAAARGPSFPRPPSAMPTPLQPTLSLLSPLFHAWDGSLGPFISSWRCCPGCHFDGPSPTLSEPSSSSPRPKEKSVMLSPSLFKMLIYGSS